MTTTRTGRVDVLEVCGLSEAELVEVARAVLSEPAAELGQHSVLPVDYPYGSPTTDGLFRIRATAFVDGLEIAWSTFVKRLRSYRQWPLFSTMPLSLQEEWLRKDPWRYQAEVYTSSLGLVLPPGVRLPGLHRVQELGDHRLALFLEDVVETESAWDRDRFARAAYILGRVSARLTDEDALPASAFRVPGELTRTYVEGRLLVASFPTLHADPLWEHPLLQGSYDLRADLIELAARVPRIVDRLTRLQQLMMHGDASPQNFLVPAADPDTFVLIDWGMGGLAAAGDDLGQLLVGLAHADQLAISDLPNLREALITAHAEGLATEDWALDEASVRYGLDGGLVIRSAFTSLPYERLDEPITDELAEFFAARLRLTRYLVDLGLALETAENAGT